MGVLCLRLANNRSTPTRTIRGSMISPPLSPDATFDAECLPPSVRPALEYISRKLQQRTMHVTLLVGRGQPTLPGVPADLMIIPITKLSPSAWKVFSKIVEKGAKRYSLGRKWLEALNLHQRHRGMLNEYLIQQSLLQNEVLFSAEGLTLLNVDRIYTIKRLLCVLNQAQQNALASNERSKIHEDKCIASCVNLLRKTIVDFHGRPFSLAFFHRVYEYLGVTDQHLIKVARQYKERYGQDGIVVPPLAISKKPPSPSPVVANPPGTTTAIRAFNASPTSRPSTHRNPHRVPPTSNGSTPTSSRRSVASSRKSTSTTSGSSFRAPSRTGTPSYYRGAKTPLSASDVTPITRNEWNILLGPERMLQKPPVTRLVPGPAAPIVE
ncbi:hypothetical protein VTN31DRAFT_316 [Thermomyces dupontii]|uniref:uncharacterized protein n=1 Tax=Talaromyces thermophilus TaxID=28565 RepID=UPI003743EEF1